MDKIRIRGGRPLSGEITIGGAKNAALPLMAAGLLTEERLQLTNVPRLADIDTMSSLLLGHGIAVDPVGNEGRVLSLGGPITSTEAPYDIVRKMRASVLVLGPLLARCREARVSLPGGCAIGTRPVDLHLKGLEQMGARDRRSTSGYINATAPGGLAGAVIVLPFASVGATENLLMAASLADGQTTIANAAREPEIGDLVACLQAMGARIEGSRHRHAGDRGRGPAARRHPPDHPRPDRDRHLRLRRRHHRRQRAAARRGPGPSRPLCTSVMHSAGVELDAEPGGVRVTRRNGLHGTDAMTEPYPGFPTDMQAQFMVLMSVAEGASMLTETIFENRFMHVSELTRMGARINVHGASAIVRGVPAPVGRAGDGDRPAGQRLPGDRGPRRGGRDGGQPGLSPGPRL